MENLQSHTCQKNTKKIPGHANVSEDEKTAAIDEHRAHLCKAKRERDLYNAAVDESKEVVKENPVISLLAPWVAQCITHTIMLNKYTFPLIHNNLVPFILKPQESVVYLVRVVSPYPVKLIT